jgi:hypothetical protein
VEGDPQVTAVPEGRKGWLPHLVALLFAAPVSTLRHRDLMLPARLRDRDIRHPDVCRDTLDGLFPDEGVEFTSAQPVFLRLHGRPPSSR